MAYTRRLPVYTWFYTSLSSVGYILRSWSTGTYDIHISHKLVFSFSRYSQRIFQNGSISLHSHQKQMKLRLLHSVINTCYCWSFKSGHSRGYLIVVLFAFSWCPLKLGFFFTCLLIFWYPLLWGAIHAYCPVVHWVLSISLIHMLEFFIHSLNEPFFGYICCKYHYPCCGLLFHSLKGIAFIEVFHFNVVPFILVFYGGCLLCPV